MVRLVMIRQQRRPRISVQCEDVLRRRVADHVGEVKVGIASDESRTSGRHLLAVSLTVDQVDVLVDVEGVVVVEAGGRTGDVVGRRPRNVDGEAVVLPSPRLLLRGALRELVEPVVVDDVADVVVVAAADGVVFVSVLIRLVGKDSTNLGLGFVDKQVSWKDKNKRILVLAPPKHCIHC